MTAAPSLAAPAWPLARPSARLADFLALTKPRVTLLVVFTGVAGLYLAPGVARLGTALSMLLGTVLLVASANTLNCYLERDSDRLMARTRHRPLPAGRMDPRHALLWGLALLALALPLLALGTNLVTAALGLLAHGGYVLVYTPLKSRSAWSTVLGGIPGAMPPLMGWTAVTGGLDVAGLALFSTLFLWQVPHTLAIGLFRGKEYAAAGTQVMPLVLGEPFTKALVVLSTALLAVVSVALHPLGLAGRAYLVVALGLGTMFLGGALTGFTRRQPTARWARGLFIFSMGYLTLLLAALCADKLG